MTIFELLFILLFLGSLVGSAAGIILALSKHRARGKNVLLTVAAVWVAYLGILGLSDAFARQHVFKPGEDVCFDEMCFAVIGAQRTIEDNADPTAPRMLYVITVRASSRSRGRPQAEGGLRARLYRDGKFFNVSERAQQQYEAQHRASAKLTQKLEPGATVLSTLVFDLPPGPPPGLTLDHGFTPGYFVFGESPFFHRPDILELPLK